MWYYFDDIIKLEDFHLDNNLMNEKSHKNILIFDISYKTLIGQKPLRIRFNKIGGFIKIYDGTRYWKMKNVTLLITELDILCYKSKKWYHIYFFSLFCKSQSWFLWFFAYQKNVKHDVITLIKSVINKDKSHYYYKIFLEIFCIN